ncbi:MAG: RNA polymerase sigma factor [Ktedonobacteraceae bacterium]
MRILSNHHNAEDVVQESLMKAYVALKSYSVERLQTLRIRAWLCTIVRNTANNYRVGASRLVHLDLSAGSPTGKHACCIAINFGACYNG